MAGEAHAANTVQRDKGKQLGRHAASCRRQRKLFSMQMEEEVHDGSGQLQELHAAGNGRSDDQERGRVQNVPLQSAQVDRHRDPVRLRRHLHVVRPSRPAGAARLRGGRADRGADRLNDLPIKTAEGRRGHPQVPHQLRRGSEARARRRRHQNRVRQKPRQPVPDVVQREPGGERRRPPIAPGSERAGHVGEPACRRSRAPDRGQLAG